MPKIPFHLNATFIKERPDGTLPAKPRRSRDFWYLKLVLTVAFAAGAGNLVYMLMKATSWTR